ncbi:TetR family transcriptional regulator [Saccharothrix coeruleofusca]|uniref:TetR family transcriptional regulator n=1 Tax=Saccharothrix coeruleofusca TaxID=33919 RepID=A0A918ECV0_9PSEU|nr:TetR family transcriptional regulator [Saccharothrix coeruleofusca]GGP42999.1 TetR family transcriptional regulator [Saccharothrix coeruleofusca]
MGRWRPDARERLQRAAFELISERGFAATTVPEITARAGLTTRTFFRHFADKREVLFAEDAGVAAIVTELMARVPASAAPLAVVRESLRLMADTYFEERKEVLRQRRELVRCDEGLRERELRKRAAVSDAIREGFLARGLDATRATLLAETCVTLLGVSMAEWLDDDDRYLRDIVRDTFETLRAELGADGSGESNG